MPIPVKAAAGALVRDRHTKQPLPTIGGDEDPALVDENDFHAARLLADGDLVRCDPAPKGRASSKGDQA